MPLKPLPPDQLRRVCTQNHFNFETTAELQVESTIIGQPRGTHAIDFGISIRSHGYNIFVLGETGTGRTTAIRRFLQQKANQQPTPPGWLYVNNFKEPHRPHIIQFTPGAGITFQRQMNELLRNLKEYLPKAFDTEQYRQEVDVLRNAFENEQNQRLQAVQEAAAAKNFTLIRTASGLNIAPVADGKALTPEMIQQLSEEERQTMENAGKELSEKLEETFAALRQKELELRQNLETLNQKVAQTSITHYFDEVKKDCRQYEAVQRYLDDMQQDVLDNLRDFLPAEEREQEPDFRQYKVNVFVNNSEIEGAPVIVEPNPTYANLLGRIEYEMQFGAMSTHFTNIKAGSLHRANGGYLVVNARDILQNPFAWEALKRAIKQREIRIQSPSAMLDGSNQVLTKSIDPEPIPLDVKVVLMGTPDIYYRLIEMDEDFGELFKVKADFDSVMPRDHEHEEHYANFIANRCRDEGLLHFDRSGVAKVVEYGARLSDDQEKLSTRFGLITDVVREASFWAQKREAKIVTGEDVRQAVNEHIYRSGRVAERYLERLIKQTVMVSTEESVAGQVNGLTVIDMGDVAFGQPSRITARTYMGDKGVVNIEREVNMAGRIHNKGLLTLIGYLGGQYAKEEKLSFAASLAFEQNYGGIDGDSASSTELYALLSSLSGYAIDQGKAVTGSVNQWGDIQPIGGAVEKIEGFFDLCRHRGLTGTQGVMIPIQNVQDLMLKEEVVEAVNAGNFHIWAVSTIDEGIELLTGIPAGEIGEDGTYPENTIHHAVQARLHDLAKSKKDGKGEEE